MTDGKEEKPKRYVDMAGTAKSKSFASVGGAVAIQGQPMQFISMEVGKCQILVDDPDGGKVIAQQPSGYLTIQARVMAEYVYDEQGNKVPAEDQKPDPELWQEINVKMYRRRESVPMRPRAVASPKVDDNGK